MDLSLMSSRDITVYLKNVVDAESLLFQQRMVKEEAQKGLCYIEPACRTVEKPQKKQIYQPAEPKAPVDTSTMIGYVLGVVFFGALAIFSLLAMSYTVITGLGLLALSGCMEVIMIRGLKSGYEGRREYPQKKQEYDAAKYRYLTLLAEEEENYRRRSEEWQEEVTKAEQEHQLAKAAARDRYEGAVEQVNLLDKPIADTEAILEELYGLDIIFPKYRNLPAVCTFYEYFSSGRCSELSGPNGAYNMYESELRQNLIINKLDTIMGSLEGIRENQYILYTEIKKAASILPMISRDVAQMLDETKGIASSSAIASQCSEAAAKNAEALKYLALVKR